MPTPSHKPESQNQVVSTEIPKRSPAALAKAELLSLGDRFGLDKAILASSWRQQRLLILGYHGIAREDEHEWQPYLYVSRQQFLRRLEILQECQCAVLRLDEAIERLYAGALQPRAVVLTFNDGYLDFYQVAWPALKAFNYPAAVYLTTYYCRFNRPVFPLMCSYLLWKGVRQTLAWPEVTGPSIVITRQNLDAMRYRLECYCQEEGLTGTDKHELLRELAGRFGVDFGEMCRRRVLHLLDSNEVRQLHAEGVEFELHTHRERVYSDRASFLSEIEENRKCIEELTGYRPRHFCYPSGWRLPEFPEWLQAEGIESATTCDAQLASRRSPRLLIPRVLDASNISEAEFRGWVTGFRAFLPVRRTLPHEIPLAPAKKQ